MEYLKWLGLSRFLIGCVVITGVLVSVIWLNLSDAQPSPVSAEPAIAVSVLVAETKSISQQMTFSGPVVGHEEVPIYADLGQGRISQVLVEEGQHIKAGTTLAVIDAAQLTVQKSQQQAVQQHAVAAVAQQQALLEQAQIQYAQAKSDRQRGESAKEPATTSEIKDQQLTAEHVAESQVKAASSGLEIAKADLALANAQLAEADLHLEQAAIKAPVAGMVINRKAHVGLAVAQTAEPLFVVLRDDAVEVELEVSGTDASRLAVGMPASIQIAGDSTIYNGRIYRAAIQIARQEQVAKIRVKFDKIPNVILGQFARVTINTSPKKAIYLPDTAFRFEGASAFVFSVRDGKALRTSVKIGERSLGMTEVLQGVTPGMQIIDGFAAYLHDGEAVMISEPSKQSAADSKQP
ncbi:MAG TPA: efflux RND transporter periplasmic adaptor subunit [Methylophilaceae bacterium]|jgi:HlyD family secretion protein